MSLDTDYWFRVVATNTAGIVTQGKTVKFRTLPNPLPNADAGPVNTIGPANNSVNAGAITGRLDGSRSADVAGGTITSYLWEQVGTPAVVISPSNAQIATFIAPASIPYPGVDLNFQLTVGSSRGPYTNTDTTRVTVKWGFLDDFSTDTTVRNADLGTTDPYIIDYFNTTGGYTATVYASVTDYTRVPGEGMNYDSIYQRAQAQMSINHGVVIDRDLPISSQGVFSMDFYPVKKYGDGAGIVFRLMQDANNYYEISNGVNDGWRASPAIKKVVGGVAVDNRTYTDTYDPVAGGSTNYPIKVTFSPTQVMWEAFGNHVCL